MTTMLPIIPEDSWVALSEFRGRRAHKVFATNGDVLTHCMRWLRRDKVTLLDEGRAIGPVTRCRQCEASA